MPVNDDVDATIAQHCLPTLSGWLEGRSVSEQAQFMRWLLLHRTRPEIASRLQRSRAWLAGYLQGLGLAHTKGGELTAEILAFIRQDMKPKEIIRKGYKPALVYRVYQRVRKGELV